MDTGDEQRDKKATTDKQTYEYTVVQSRETYNARLHGINAKLFAAYNGRPDELLEIAAAADADLTGGSAVARRRALLLSKGGTNNKELSALRLILGRLSSAADDAIITADAVARCAAAHHGDIGDDRTGGPSLHDLARAVNDNSAANAKSNAKDDSVFGPLRAMVVAECNKRIEDGGEKAAICERLTPGGKHAVALWISALIEMKTGGLRGGGGLRQWLTAAHAALVPRTQTGADVAPAAATPPLNRHALAAALLQGPPHGSV